VFGHSIRLFSLFGFAVKVDLSWLILALLVTWSLAVGFFPVTLPGYRPGAYWAMGVAGALGVFFSIVFHEFSHALVARRYGLPIRGITLFIFGGVAEMEDEPASAMVELRMAAAGPAASVVLALVFFGASRLLLEWGAGRAVAGVLYYLAGLNLLLALFNLVPAFPLDGGRMLRALLWRWRGNLHEATRTASAIGRGFGVVLILLGVFFVITGNFVGGMWWFLIGLFLRAAADASFRQLRIREVLKGEPVRRFMNVPVTVDSAASVQELVEHYLYRFHYKLYPVVDGETLRGCVGIEQIKSVPRERWDETPVRTLMEGCSAENTIAPEVDAMEAMGRMNRLGRSRLMVVEQGRLVGIIAMRDLMSFIALRLDLEKP